MTATLRVNGADKPFTGPRIPDLLAAEGVSPDARFIAVSVNETVVPRVRWHEVALKPGDAVEIVKPVQGG